MRIIVCVKQVPDPEGPRECFLIDSEQKKVEPRGIPPVVSLFDENALEAGLRIKEKDPNKIKVSVLSMGKKISKTVMEKVLAAGADELFKVEGEEFDSGNLDSYRTAFALSSAIKKIGEFDLLLAGRESADWNWGQVSIGLASFLGLPVITLARKVEINGNYANIERVLSQGYEIVKAQLPAVIMVSNEIGVLRYPTMIQRREAKNKPITAWCSEDIGFDGLTRNKTLLRRLYPPEISKRQCEIMGGASPAEAGKRLAEELRKIKAL